MLTPLGSLAIFVGFASFFFMEKTLRVLSGDEEDSNHSHSHSHSHSIGPPKASEASSVTSAVETSSSKAGLKQRRDDGSRTNENDSEVEKQPGGPSKLSAYLNLFGDFVHNMYALLRSAHKMIRHADLELVLSVPMALRTFQNRPTSGRLMYLCLFFSGWQLLSTPHLRLVQRRLLHASRTKFRMKSQTIPSWSEAVSQNARRCSPSS